MRLLRDASHFISFIGYLGFNLGRVLLQLASCLHTNLDNLMNICSHALLPSPSERELTRDQIKCFIFQQDRVYCITLPPHTLHPAQYTDLTVRGDEAMVHDFRF